MKTFLQKIRNYFVPHTENDFKPHFFSTASILFLTAVILAVFLISTLQYTAIRTGNYAAIVTAVLTDLTNNDRLIEGRGWLKTNPTLALAAQMKANDMAAKSYFAHMSPDGKNPWYWFKQVGYNFVYAGENLAVNFSDSVDVERAWMNSPGHRTNIVNSKYTEIGIATAEGVYNGRPTTFVVQLFGRPAEATSTPAVIPSVVRAVGEKATTTIKAEPLADRAVAGATIADTNDQFIEIVSEEGTPIAVKQKDGDAVTTEESTVVLATGEQSASFFARIFSSPNTFLQYAYVSIAVLIVLALIIDIVVEIRRQHPLHIVYATLLLALIFALLYISRAYLFPEILIL